MRGKVKRNLPSIRFGNMVKAWKDVPSLVDDGTLDYLVMLPDGSVHRFNREYVLDTYGDCCYATLAEQLAEEIECS